VAALDLAGVAAADSAGLAVLLALARDARAAGTPLRIAGAPESLRALAQLAEVDQLLGLA
jgi:ABC-type transporter Mla MlaB component